MDDPEVIKAWAKTTLHKCVEDAVAIQRVPEIKCEEVLTLIYSLVDHLYQGNDTSTTFDMRRHVRKNGGAVPFIGGHR